MDVNCRYQRTKGTCVFPTSGDAYLLVCDPRLRGIGGSSASWVGWTSTIGRYDMLRHSLFWTPDDAHHNDFHQPNFTIAVIAKGGLKEPCMHEIHCRLEVPMAWDVLYNFEQRWHKQGGKDLLILGGTEFLRPSSESRSYCWFKCRATDFADSGGEFGDTVVVVGTRRELQGKSKGVVGIWTLFKDQFFEDVPIPALGDALSSSTSRSLSQLTYLFEDQT